jgi:hypothetical protein
VRVKVKVRVCAGAAMRTSGERRLAATGAEGNYTGHWTLQEATTRAVLQADSHRGQPNPIKSPPWGTASARACKTQLTARSRHG